jgi:hypothetical protein
MKVPVARTMVLGLAFIACVACRREEPAPLKSMPMAGNCNPNSKMTAIIYPTLNPAALNTTTLTPVAMNSTSGLKLIR